jgi:hypothetical protein
MLKLKGLNQRVEVLFDDYGVPHIYGQNEEDVYFAFGYVHAQERLFQMEMMRRVSAGRLSEILGSSVIEVDKFFDLPDEYLTGMMAFAKPIAKAIEKSFRCNRCGMSVVGLEVPHAHLHLVPINGINDLNFTRGKIKVTPEQLKKAQEKILANL